jgi:hypothetical protein
LFCLAFWGASAQASAANPNAALMTQLVALRNSFIRAIEDQGYKPRLPPPTVVLDNPPSYGNYEDHKNLLHIAVWSALSEEQRQRFERLRMMLNATKPAEQIFDDSVHHWVFVHELGHWWQASQRKTSKNHYSVEYGANRVAAAFWRQTDPDLMRQTENRMTTVIQTLPRALPPGQYEEAYFNENYENLGPTPAYIWFQYTMVLKVQAEQPLPSLKQALSEPVFP